MPTEPDGFTQCKRDKDAEHAAIELQTAEFLEFHDIELIESGTSAIKLNAEKIKRIGSWGDSDKECR